MTGENDSTCFHQCRLSRCDLMENINAIAVRFDHSLNAGDLPRDPLEPVLRLITGHVVHGRYRERGSGTATCTGYPQFKNRAAGSGAVE